ncbi:MAG: hypothetical protein IIA45_13720 [Bacteroidetes bacterium]|nr:hypothetical protein [Bacteroidota bacterium]
MLKHFLYIIIIGAFTASQFGCSTKTPDTLDAGSVKRDVYTNEYLGIHIPIPDNWVVASEATMATLLQAGKEAMAGDGDQAVVDESINNMVNLLMITQHPHNAAVQFNPSLIVIAIKSGTLPGVNSARDYVESTSNSIRVGAVPFEIIEGIHEEPIGSKQAIALEAVINLTDIKIYQNFYAIEIKDYLVAINLSTNKEADRILLQQTLKDITWD